MKQVRTNKAGLFIGILALLMPAARVWAQAGQAGCEKLCGEWQVKIDFDGRQMESILSFWEGEEGKPEGDWISSWRVSELKDVKYEEGQLSFARERRNRQGQITTSKFTGTIKDGKLSGTMSGERGERKLNGERSKQMPGAVGSWEMKLKRGKRELTSTLIVKADKEGKLAGEWRSERGEHEITDVEYEGGKLTFKRKIKRGDIERESTFEGTVEGDTLSGVMKSERGETKAEGKRICAALIGNWDLEVTSERGNYKQRLKVNGDMSGMYGAAAIEKVNLEGDKVSFKTVVELGEQKFDVSFEGKLEGSKLTGELLTARGMREVTGTKVVRTCGR